MGELEVEGLVCPKCGGPLSYIPGYRLDGTRYRKAVALRPSERRVAPDDEVVQEEPQGQGFAARPGRRLYRHTVTMVCNRCNRAFSRGQAVAAGGEGEGR